MVRKMKYKVGDEVKILVGFNIDKVGTIEEVDPDWEYPYALTGTDELYKEDQLCIVSSEVVEDGNEIHTATDVDMESQTSEVEDSYYLIVYNSADGRTIMFAPNENLLVDDKYDVEPKENPYLQGFFDGLSYAGMSFVIKLQYLT